jgi:probable rRNA maturation factor
VAKVSIMVADVSFRLSNKRRLYSWLEEVVDSEGLQFGNVGIILCSDNYLLELNQRFLLHDYFTDIITFDYCENNIVNGELYISIDRVKENAMKYNQDLPTELNRVMVHGVLHLCGYKDKTKAEQKKMRQKEGEKLKILMS